MTEANDLEFIGSAVLKDVTRGRVVQMALLVQGAHHILGPFGADSDLRRWGLKLAERGGKNGEEPEQIVTLLRQIEVGIANGKTTPQARNEAAIMVQTYYRWRKEYGGLKLELFLLRASAFDSRLAVDRARLELASVVFRRGVRR